MKDYEFDINDWLGTFPLESYDADALMSGHGPADICYTEQIRRLAAKQGNLGRPVPVDVFVLAYGEPERRDITKIGGLPYRPADKPWPVSVESGKEMTFIAQFRFTESKDIVGPVPDDILLCFFDETAVYDSESFPGPPVFEWYPLGMENLISSEQLPTPQFAFPTCYGVRHRTVDYVDERAFELVRSIVPPEFLKHCNEEADVRETVLYDCILGMFKIGGATVWDAPETWRLEQEVKKARDMPKNVLCSLSEIYVPSEGQYPWLNFLEEQCTESMMLHWSSSGIVYLFLDDQGTVQPRFQGTG
jgi:hypothetical protein